MNEDDTAVKRGAGCQRTHCLKGSRAIHTWTRKNKSLQRCQDNYASSLWVWWQIEFAAEVAAVATLKELEVRILQ